MGFWSTLGKGLGIAGAVAAIPFTGGMSLATTMPWLTGALGAGSLVAGMLGSRGKGGSLPGVGGGVPANFGGDMTAVNNAIAGQQANVNRVNASGVEADAMAQKALRPTLGYYNRLVSGDQKEGMQAIAPEVNTILDQYDIARRTASQTMGRGGGRTRALAMLPFQKQGTIMNLLFGARRDAADKLSTLGTNLTNAATSRFGTGLQGQSSIINAEGEKNRMTLAGQLGLLDAQKVQYQKDKDFGSALGGFINSILMGLPFGKKSGGSSGPTVTETHGPVPGFEW